MIGSKGDAADESTEYVDPAPIPRLSRRNILALILSLAGVVLVLFFSSRERQSDEASPYELTVSPVTDALTLQPVEPQTPIPSPWQSSPNPRLESSDERKSSYDQARQSRGVVHVSSPVSPDTVQASIRTSDVGDRLLLLEGSVIDAALETRIHTGRPGPVRARVIRPVRDSKHLEDVLIPAGTRLIGVMEGAFDGQEPRALIVWNRMIFPNGETRDLPGLPALDQNGEGGLQDQVNYHRIQRFGSAAMLALLGSATSIATASTAGGLVGGALAMELSRTASNQFEKKRRLAPSLILNPGYSFLVYVSNDMEFSESYTE